MSEIAKFPPIASAAPRTAKTGMKPKPSAIRVGIEGNRGHRPPDPLEPKPAIPSALPPAPAHLSELAANLWEVFGRLVLEMRVLSAADLTAMEILCQAECKRLELEDDLRENGMFQVVTTTVGEQVERVRPQVAECDKKSKQVLDALREFGLTPASRPKVQMVPGGKRGGGGDGEEGEDYF